MVEGSLHQLVEVVQAGPVRKPLEPTWTVASVVAKPFCLQEAALCKCIHCVALFSVHIHAAIPDNLTATKRRPTYMVVEWTAPPSPFSGNYQLTYGPLGGTTNSTAVTDTSYNITGLQPFTNYTVAVQANNDPVMEFGPPLSEEFFTLPEGTLPPGVDPPSVSVPQVGTGSSEIVKMVIPPPGFGQDFLR